MENLRGLIFRWENYSIVMYQSIIQGLSGGRRDLRCRAKLRKQKPTIPFSIFDGRLGPLTLTFVRSAYFMHCSALARSSLRRCLMDLTSIIDEHAIFVHPRSLVARVRRMAQREQSGHEPPRPSPRPHGHQSVMCPLKKKKKKKKDHHRVRHAETQLRV